MVTEISVGVKPMTRSAVKLTKRTVDSAASKPSRYILWDRELAGFGLRVEPKGKKSFLIRYRPKGTGRTGPKRFLKLGDFGPMTADQARDEARRKLGDVAHGDDPAASRVAAREALTLAELIELFLEHVQLRKKPGTAALYAYYLRKLVAPGLGKHKAASIEHAEVVKLHDAIGKSKPTTANRTVAALSGLYTFAEKSKQVPAGMNPAKGIEKFKERARERYLTPEELGRLGDALHLAETEGLPWSVDETKPKSKHLAKAGNRRRQLDPFAIAAIRLLILTGARLREVLHAKWEQIDTERGVLFLADNKTGRKPVYLSSAAQAILTTLPRIEGNPYLIAGAKDGAPRADLKKPWEAVKKVAGLEGLRIHDLRHTFASSGAGASLGLPIIGKLLGHSQPATTHRYAHLDADPLRRAADTIGATIAAAMGGNKSAAVVVPFKNARAP